MRHPHAAKADIVALRDRLEALANAFELEPAADADPTADDFADWELAFAIDNVLIEFDGEPGHS